MGHARLPDPTFALARPRASRPAAGGGKAAAPHPIPEGFPWPSAERGRALPGSGPEIAPRESRPRVFSGALQRLWQWRLGSQCSLRGPMRIRATSPGGYGTTPAPHHPRSSVHGVRRKACGPLRARASDEALRTGRHVREVTCEASRARRHVREVCRYTATDTLSCPPRTRARCTRKLASCPGVWARWRPISSSPICSGSG